jgi:hypothetical protein
VPGTYIFAVIALGVAGAVTGILAVVSLGIRREDRRGGFPARPRGWLARSARRATGAGIRTPELAVQPSRRKDILPV